MTKQVRKERSKRRTEHRELQESNAARPGTVDSILSLVLIESKKLDVAKEAYRRGLMSFSEYHEFSSSIGKSIATYTRLARDMTGPYMHLGDISVTFDMDPQVAIPHEDGSVDLEPLAEIELDGRRYFRFEDSEGVVKLLPINRQIEPSQ